jgi:class 3 adenylate cyclase
VGLQAVALLMTDLVGSTETSARLGPVAAEELRREHFTMLRAAIERNDGSEVKSLGDGLMAVFVSASDALACAVEMQQGVDATNRRGGEPCEIRVSVSFGEVTLDGGDYFGEAAVEAARLCTRAVGGEILVTGVACRVAGTRHEHEFRALGELELKGLPGPVESLQLVWEPLLAGGLPLPERLSEQAPVEMVGRRGELGELLELWGQASRGPMRLALIGGEAGVGKTRLCTQLSQQLHAAGATILYGRCDEDLPVPYQPWLQVLGHLVEHAPRTILESHVEARGGEIARLVPALSERVPGCPPPRQTDPDTERYLLYAAVAALIDELAAQGAVLVFLDDLHWADAPTLSLLRHIASAQISRSMLIGTFRDSDLQGAAALTALLADLRRESGIERFDLDGLAAGDVLALIEAAAGHAVDAGGRELAERLTCETAGNPFFTIEMLRHMRESGAIARDDAGRWRLTGDLGEIGLPRSVIEVIDRRVERLGANARTALSAAAVIGRDFDVEVLGAVVELGEEELFDVLEQATQASILGEAGHGPGRFAFTHALVEHALYEGLGGIRRARIHHRIAEALESRYGADPGDRLGELASHWGSAVVSIDAAKACHYAQLAGERALGQLAPSEAARWYRQALELLGQAGGDRRAARCQLLIGLGEAQRQVGDAGFRETLLEASRIARDLHDTAALVRAALANNRGFASNFGGVDSERVETLQAAAEALDRDAPQRAEVLALLASELQFGGDPGSCEALADAAIAIARASGDAATLARTMTDAWGAIVAPGTLAKRREMIGELNELAARLDDPRLTARAAARRTLVGLECGERSLAELGMGTLRGVAEAVPEPWISYLRLLMEFGWELLGGDLQAAERWAGEAYERGSRGGQPDAAIFYGAHVFHVRYFEGRAGELVEQVMALGGERGKLSGWRAGAAALALIQAGRSDEARELAAAEDFDAIAVDEAWSIVMLLWADACSLAGAVTPAREMLELLSPFSGQLAVSGAHVYGSLDFALGALAATLGRIAEAEEYFARAAALETRLSAPLLLARTHARWARALVAHGRAEDRSRAEMMLERAEGSARSGKAHGIAHEIAECRRDLVAVGG